MSSYYRLVPIAMLAAAWVAMQDAWPGGLYRWVDEKGEVHYSDTPPPPNVKSQKELKPRAPTATTPGTQSAPKTYQQEDAAFRKRQVEQAEKDAAAKKARQEATEKQRNC